MHRQPSSPPPSWQPPAELLSTLRSTEPAFATFLDRMKPADAERWRAELWNLTQESRHAAMLRGRGEPERAARLEATGQLERAVRAVVEGLDGQPPSDAESAKLRDALGKLFDLREESRRGEITELETRITELKAGLAERRARKSEIVERRLKEMLAQSDAPEW